MEFNINKGINRAIEFKGIRAQYLAYLAVGLVGLLLVFAVGYIAGVSFWILAPAVGIAGFTLITTVTRYSHTYGKHGLMKLVARKQVPSAILCRQRNLFLTLKKETSHDHHR